MRQITISSPGFSRFPTAAILENERTRTGGPGCANHPSGRVNFFVSFVNGSPSLVVKRKEVFMSCVKPQRFIPRVESICFTSLMQVC